MGWVFALLCKQTEKGLKSDKTSQVLDNNEETQLELKYLDIEQDSIKQHYTEEKDIQESNLTYCQEEIKNINTQMADLDKDSQEYKNLENQKEDYQIDADVCQATIKDLGNECDFECDKIEEKETEQETANQQENARLETEIQAHEANIEMYENIIKEDQENTCAPFTD